MRNSIHLNGMIGISPSPERPAEEQIGTMKRQQRAVWHVLAAVAVVEILLGGWLIGMLPH